MRTVFCALSFLLLTPPAALAAKAVDPSPQQITEYEASTESTRVKLLIRLAKSGQHELAAGLLKRYPLSGKFGKNRQLFIEGLILKARGNLTGAAKNYRAALADDPSLTLVRAELAQTLFQLEEDDSAKHHLNLLMAEAPNDYEAQGIRSFIDTIDERRPFKFNAYVSAAPSTNVNNGSSNKTIYAPLWGVDMDIDDDSRKQSGIGFSTGFSAGYARRLGNDFSVVLGGGVNASIYTDSDYNVYNASQSAELRYLLTGGFLGVGLVASENMKNDEIGLSYYSYGPRVSLQKAITPQDRINLSSVYEWRNYPDTSWNDGTALKINGSWNHAFDSSLTASLGTGYDRMKTERDFTSYETWSGSVGLYKELPKGITVNLNGEFRLSEFDAMHPIAGVTRKDDRYLGSIALTKRDLNIWGYAPSLEYTYVYNDSNISLYEFDSHALDFRLSKDF
ncbi:MAG: porin family protein [Aestuariivirga sp.]|nr:porin family protein [Aestuariivirga sp.]